MKKLVAFGPGKCGLEEVPMPVIERDDEVIVKLKYCGVCRSEHYGWSTAEAGMTFGHEPVGVVYKVGKNVKRFKVGDRVSGLFSGNAEYVLALEKCLFKIPDCLSDEEAVLEPLSCLISAVSKVRIPVVGDKVAVVGCGYMGCGAISLLAMRGAHVVAVDIRRECLEDAKKFGAAEVYTPDELPAKYLTVSTDHNDHLSEQTEKGERGLKLVMEWAETNESLDLAINMTRMCGQIAVGAYHTGEKRLVNVEQLNVKAIDMLSTHPREMELNIEACRRAIELLCEGRWNFRHIPTKIYPITRFDEAQGELVTKYGKHMKSLVDWTKTEGEPYITE